MRYWEREKTIMDLLAERESVSLTEICGRTGASVATVRRDFETIRSKGLAERFHGGLRLPQQKESEALHYINGTEIVTPADREKYAIAREAAAQIRAGDSIFIGAGKTCNIFASMLRGIDRLTVVTTSISAVMELVDCPSIRLTLLGGDVHTGKNFVETLDADIGQTLRNYYFDKVFLTCEGVDLERGYTVQDKSRTPLYAQLTRMTRRLYLLIDSSKYDRKTFATVYPMEKICRVITTKNLPSAYTAFYSKRGIPCTQVVPE